MRLIDADAFDKCLENAEAEATHMRKYVFASAVNVVRGNLRSFPTIEPERKKGKWIYSEDEYGIDGYHCDKCGFFVPWDYVHKFINYIEDYNFCPNCGADMRGEK